jgi:hypothetical protein
MPPRLVRDEDTDRNLPPLWEAEAVKQIACGYADYQRRIRAWLDLNLESRRPSAQDGDRAIQQGGGTGSW